MKLENPLAGKGTFLSSLPETLDNGFLGCLGYGHRSEKEPEDTEIERDEEKATER